MELVHLRSFLEVARTGSLTRAAEALMLTQPAVTQHIQALERELGAVIFDRTSRGARLTTPGRALQRHATESLASLDRAKAAVQAAEAGVTGNLTFGSSVTLAGSGISECIKRLRDQHAALGL